MLNRNVSLAVCLCVIAGVAFAQSNQGTGYIFQFANSTGASGQFQGFVYNTQSLGTPVFNTTGPSGADLVIPKPDGSKFYVVGPGGVYDFNPAFTTSANLNGISGTPTQAIISPDGRYLLVASNLGGGAGSVFIVNTTNDAVVLNEPVSGSIVAMVVSRNGTTAWILGESSQTFITIVSLPAQGSPQQVGSPVILRDPVSGDSLGGAATSMTLSPLGLLYVSGGNQILEINPAVLTTFEPTFTEISVFATAGPLQFSTDGTMAYFINTTTASGGPSLLSMAIPSHTITTWPPFVEGQQPEQFDSILIASPTRLFAHSPADNTLWDVAPDFSQVGVSALNSVLPATSVFSIALSNELPTAQYLYALIGSGTQASIYRVVLTTNTVNSQASAALGPGTLQFAIVPPTVPGTNPTGFIQYNATQTNLAAGATALPLIARVLDPIGRPMFGVPVSFTGDPSLTIVPANSTTNEDGYVQAIVTMGTSAEAPGNYPVTLTAGSGSSIATTTFALAIPGGVGTGPTGGGPNQMTIISGNGGLYQAQNASFATTSALTVQLLDTNGNPLVNQSVTFTVVGPQIALLDNPNATTDTNGMAQTDFIPQAIPQNTPYQGTTVTAVAAQGAVTFNETVWQPDPNSNDSAPTAVVEVPVDIAPITGAEGDVLPGAIVGVVYAHGFGSNPPIPNVAINITTNDGSGNPGPATCQGNPLTDVTGTVTCNLIPVCSTTIDASTMLPWGLGLQPFTIDFGYANDKPGYFLNIIAGSGQALVIHSGNNQSGRPGTALSIPLTATVTDQCGASAGGTTVTWKVTQGSATLSTATTVSNAGGNVSTQLTLGQTPGTVQVVASINSTNLVTFTETITAVVGSLTLVSGGGQSALEGQAFTSPLVFQVKDTSNNPVPGLTVNFSLASGTASISTTSATTNSSGQVSVNVTAGNVAGTVTITATYGTLTSSGTLTVTAPGLPLTLSSFVSAASGQPGLAPCGLAVVTGAGLAPTISGVVSGSTLGIAPWPYTLANVSISVNGTPAPLEAVSNQNGVQQVNFQTPCETVPGSPATVVVQVGSSSTQVTGVTVYPAQPGIFTYAGPGGSNYAYVIDSNGNPLTPSNLASAGKTYFLIATGMGETIPPASTNAVGTGEIVPASSVILAINNVGVPVSSVQYQQGARGVYVIAFTIPVPFGTGTNLPIALGVNVNSQTFFDNSPVVLPGIH
jgi:uncharacterized protein (TIGR03437 family)